MRHPKLERFFDIAGEIVAFFAVAVYVIWILDLTFDFIPNGSVASQVINGIKLYATLILLIIVGLEATIKRPLIVRLFFYAMAAVVLIFSFFPQVWQNISSNFEVLRAVDYITSICA